MSELHVGDFIGGMLFDIAAVLLEHGAKCRCSLGFPAIREEFGEMSARSGTAHVVKLDVFHRRGGKIGEDLRPVHAQLGDANIVK